MSRPEKRRPGDRITAKAWNEIIDRLPGNSSGLGVGDRGVSQVRVRIKNGSGGDRDKGEVLSLSYDGPADEFDAELSPHFVGIVPAWHSNITAIAVLAEPIPDGEFGDAVIAGMCIAKVSAGSEKEFVMIDPDTPTQFKYATGGVGRKIGAFSGFACVDLSTRQTLWRYQLSENPSGVTYNAKLLQLNDDPLSNSVDLEDPDGLMDDQELGDVGFCIHVGNNFYAIQAVC